MLFWTLITGIKSPTPRPPSHHTKSVASDHPPSEPAVADNEPDSATEPVASQENVEEVVEEVMKEVVEEADEAQDLVVDIDMSDVPKGPRISVGE